MQNWLPINYSFIFVLISLTSLISMRKIRKNFHAKMRLVIVISIYIKKIIIIIIMYLVHDIIIFVNLHKYFNLSNFKEQVTSVLWRNMSKDHCYERLSQFFFYIWDRWKSFHFWQQIANCLHISTWLCDKECPCIPRLLYSVVEKTGRAYLVHP